MWLPAQDQASEHSNQDRGEAHKAPPLAESYWQFITAEERRESRLRSGAWPLLDCLYSSVGDPTLVYTLAALVRFSWLFFKK